MKMDEHNSVFEGVNSGGGGKERYRVLSTPLHFCLVSLES